MARGCCLFECSGTPTAYYPQIRLQPCAFFLLLTAIFGLRDRKYTITMGNTEFIICEIADYSTQCISRRAIIKKKLNSNTFLQVLLYPNIAEGSENEVTVYLCNGDFVTTQEEPFSCYMPEGKSLQDLESGDMLTAVLF